MIRDLGRLFRCYREYARIGFVNILAFRLRYYTGVATSLINVSVYYFIWKALYASGGEPVSGFDLGEMITYVAVGWMIRSIYFNNIDQNVADDVQTGAIVMALMRPASAQTMYLGQAFGEAAFRVLLLTAPTAVAVILIFPVQAPASAGHAAAFVLALLGSIVLVAALNFIVGALAIRMKSILGLLRAKYYVQELLSGLLVPITMFPPAVAAAMAWLPFEHIAYTPLLIYLGKLDGAPLAQALAAQWLWAGLLLAFGSWFWDRMARKLTIQGG